jgi:hypothetical protein
MVADHARCVESRHLITEERLRKRILWRSNDQQLTTTLRPHRLLPAQRQKVLRPLDWLTHFAQ